VWRRANSSGQATNPGCSSLQALIEPGAKPISTTANQRSSKLAAWYIQRLYFSARDAGCSAGEVEQSAGAGSSRDMAPLQTFKIFTPHRRGTAPTTSL